jgi:hypothetical protein
MYSGGQSQSARCLKYQPGLSFDAAPALQAS